MTPWGDAHGGEVDPAQAWRVLGRVLAVVILLAMAAFVWLTDTDDAMVCRNSGAVVCPPSR